MTLSSLAKVAVVTGTAESAGAGINISSDKNNPETVTSSVVGLAGNVAIDVGLASARFTAMAGTAATGIGIAIAIFQITFALIDSFINPFQTYFNKDLADFKNKIDEQINTAFLSNGYGFPLEVKPDIFPKTDAELNTFQNYIRKYNEDNGLITQEDVLLEENLINELRKINRAKRISTNPFFENQQILSSTSQYQALLIAASAAQKKGYSKQRPKLLMDYSKYQAKPKQPTPQYNFIKNDWQILIMILIIIILSSISLIILTYNI
jgi:hypothetical protein